MPIIPVKNYTRYNTQDFEALVEHIEKYVSLNNGGTKVTANVNFFEINNYTGGVPKERRRRYHSDSRQPDRLYLGRTQYRHPERMSIVEPQHAFENELEWLATAASEAPSAPAAMVRAIGEVMLSRYRLPWSPNRTNFNTDGLILRIEGAVAAKKTNDDKRVDRLDKARRRLHAAAHVMNYARKRMRSSLGSLRIAKGHLKGEEVAIDNDIERLEALLLEADEVWWQLNSQYEHVRELRELVNA